jgi:protein ImuA
MKLLTCHNGQLHAARSEFASFDANGRSSFTTGFVALDELLPNGAFARGAVHELLSIPSHPSPFFVALFIARAGMMNRGLRIEDRWKKNSFLSSILNPPSSSSELTGAIVWCDPQGKLYPPAVAAMGVPLDRLFLLRPKTIPDENWAIAECLRCRGVSATIASPRRLSRIEARRFQLAAERGKGIGILLRPYDRTANVYSATTRWLVSPQRGLRTVQRWRIELIHGHGGQVGAAVILEHHRETNSIEVHPVRAVEQLADRPVPAPARAG